MAVDVSSPFWQGFTRKLEEQIPTLKRPIGNNRHALFYCGRQQSAFHLSIKNIVSELHEVDGLGLDDLLKLLMPSAMRGRDSDIANGPLVFVLLQDLEVMLPGDQIVNLVQIKLL